MEDDSMHEVIPIKTKPPQPARPGSPSLITLGYDITPLVIDELLISSPSTLLSGALVSSYYYELARYSRHSTVTLRLGHGKPKSVNPRGYGDRAEQCADLLEWLNQTSAKGLLPAIRHLTIHIDRNDDAKDLLGKQTRDTLAAHLPHMTGLADLTWTGDEILPDQIVQVLSERPGLRLHVHYEVQDRKIHDTDYNPRRGPLSVLVGLANLKSLSIESESDFVTWRQCYVTLWPIKDILLTCKDLLKLRFNIRLLNSPLARHLWLSFSKYKRFGLVNGQRPVAALRELELIAYPFVNGEDPSGPGMFPGRPVIPFTMENYWAETFDWSRLERLVVDKQVYLASKILPYLKSLRHIEFRSAGTDLDLIKAFLSQVPDGLETILVGRISRIGVDALLRHSSTLRKLSIHQTERWPRIWCKEAPRKSDMTRIRDTCVEIEELEVDVRRAGGEWPYAMLDIIAGFPRLRRLRLWFEIGLHDITNPVKPYMTASAAQHLFDCLLSRSTVTPSRLRSIMIYLGAPWGRPPQHYTAAISKPENTPTAFQCRVSDRDDDAPPHTYEFNVAYLTWSGPQSD